MLARCFESRLSLEFARRKKCTPGLKISIVAALENHMIF